MIQLLKACFKLQALKTPRMEVNILGVCSTSPAGESPMSTPILQRHNQMPQPKILQYQVLQVVPNRGLIVRILNVRYGISNGALFSFHDGNEWFELGKCHIDVLHTLNHVFQKYIAQPKPQPQPPTRPQPSYARYGGVKPVSRAQARFLQNNLSHIEKD